MQSFYSRPASTLIRLRSSWRSCSGEALPPEKLEALRAFINSRNQGLFGKPLRFELVAARPGDETALRGLGTYGFIRGAAGFVVGALEQGRNNLEDYGYRMQEIILLATDLDLATCWLGGSFQKDNFSARIKTQDHEVVPAVVSVGVPADRRNLVDRSIRLIAGSKHRLPWEALFFDHDGLTPLAAENVGEFAQVLEMVRLSPSASNKQPWRLLKEGANFHFYLRRTKGYRRPGLFSDLQRIDMGIALCHFEQGCIEEGLLGGWVGQVPSFPVPQDWEYTLSWRADV